MLTLVFHSKSTQQEARHHAQTLWRPAKSLVKLRASDGGTCFTYKALMY